MFPPTLLPPAVTCLLSGSLVSPENFIDKSANHLVRLCNKHFTRQRKVRYDTGSPAAKPATPPATCIVRIGDPKVPSKPPTIAPATAPATAPPMAATKMKISQLIAMAASLKVPGGSLGSVEVTVYGEFSVDMFLHFRNGSNAFFWNLSGTTSMRQEQCKAGTAASVHQHSSPRTIRTPLASKGTRR